jgi:Alkylmercury lyase
MSPPSLLDKTYNVIIKRLVETGQAPHYTEIAAELGVSVEEARRALHTLMSAGIPGIWLFPDTDYISSFAPFSNLPTQYRISVDGEEKWFGQWGFESLAVCWLFPGKLVQINAPCLDCGSPVQVEIRDGDIVKTEPKGIMGYVAVPFSKWMNQLPHAWSTMNLFRSEDHIRNWTKYDPEAAGGILPLEDLLRLFSGNFFQRRLDFDYVSSSQDYLSEFIAAINEVAQGRPFWSPGPL